MKAMYVAVSRSSRNRDTVRRMLTDSRTGLELRKAAAWALFTTVSDRRTSEELVDIAEDSRADEDLRVEVLKSLFLALGYNRIRDDVLDLAESNAPQSVRVAATRTVPNILMSPS